MIEQLKEIVPLFTPIFSLMAVVISIFALGIPIRKEIRKSKIAVVTGWFASSSADANHVERFIIANLGPATARNIKVSFTDSNGNPWTPWTSTTSAVADPLIYLAAGDQFHIQCGIGMNTKEPINVRFEWDDDSKKHGVRESTLSLLGIPLGSHGLNDKVILDKVIREMNWQR